MSDFNLVDPNGWEYDLQSVYSAYIGYFQLHNIPWYERSWGHLFESFREFLAFSWPVITVSDADTGKAHVVTRLTSIKAFLKMIKTRFGESLPQVDNMLKVNPFETSARPLRTVTDWPSYKKLHATLPAVTLIALKARIHSGDTKAIRTLWENRDKTFLSMDFEWSERNQNSCLEWGYAALRCGFLEALGHWPPIPDANYRKGHYVVAEYADKVINKHRPTFPWQYEFGESQVISKAKLPVVIQAVISSLASPDSEMIANNLVLIGHGIHSHIAHFEEMKIKVPHNVLIIDVGVFEAKLHAAGDGVDRPRNAGITISLASLVQSFLLHQPSPTPAERRWQPCINNAGNGAFLSLFSLQKLLDPQHTPPLRPRTKPAAGVPSKVVKDANMGAGVSTGMSAGMGMGIGLGVVPSGSLLQIPVVPAAGYHLPAFHRPRQTALRPASSTSALRLVDMNPPSTRRVSWVAPQLRGPGRSSGANAKHRWSSAGLPASTEALHADQTDKGKENGVAGR